MHRRYNRIFNVQKYYSTECTVTVYSIHLFRIHCNCAFSTVVFLYIKYPIISSVHVATPPLSGSPRSAYFCKSIQKETTENIMISSELQCDHDYYRLLIGRMPCSQWTNVKNMFVELQGS